MKKTLLSLTLFLGTINLKAQVPGYVPLTDLSAWYPFNGNSLDESGKGNHMQLYNSPALTADRFGKAKSAINLDGIDDYMITQKASFNASKNHTLALWFRLAKPERRWQTIYNTEPHRIEGLGYNWFLTRSFNYALGDGTDWTITDDTYNNLDTFALPLLKDWNHLVVVKNGLNWYFYMNGKLAYSNLVSADPFSFATPLWFGSISYTGSPYEQFEGDMDDIGTWERALDATEIKTMYDAKPTSLTTLASSSRPLIYPTLAHQELYIDGSVSEIQIVNTLGQLVKEQKGLQQHLSHLDITDLPSGLYMAKLKTGTESGSVQRFIKQ